MGVPATLADLDPIAANNSPSGSDPIGTNLDDYLRSHAALIKQAYSNAIALIPTGTRMPFAQAAAPTGWTQDTSDNATNRMLRVVNTTGNGVGGSHSPILNNVVPSHTHGFTTNSTNTDHTHYDPGHAHGGSYMRSDLSGGNNGGGANTWGLSTTTTAYTNLGFMNQNATHTHTGTSNANGSAANWTPRYIDMIICSKDA